MLWLAWETVRTPRLDQEKGVDENVEVGSNGEDARIFVYPEGQLRGHERHRWVSNQMRAEVG